MNDDLIAVADESMTELAEGRGRERLRQIGESARARALSYCEADAAKEFHSLLTSITGQ